ncbi:MAG: Rpn family recombination-promoting nuclease/putative transposase [Lachnospiraceae bacterium]|nr:Rpn family recombination-promoting nuclease/putative transposase [Lachnospiraceae bacterium]
MPDNVRPSIRPLSELNLIDNFLFSTLMENPEIAEKLTRIILKRTLGYVPEKFSIETQKKFNGIDMDKHGIHLDVLVKETDETNTVKTIYDIEPNVYYEKYIAKRNRYYNALVDVKLLNASAGYSTLPELTTIWILPYDPFGDKKMIYTIKNIVEENPDIVYNDGIKTIILNASAAIGSSGELENLLNFMVDSDKEDLDFELAEIKSAIQTIKGNSEVGEEYMSMQTAMYYEKKMSYEEGEQRGIEIGERRGEQRGIENLTQRLLELGVDKEILEKAKTPQL